MKIEIVPGYNYEAIALAGSELVDRMQDVDLKGPGHWHRFKGHFIDHILGDRVDNITLPAEGFSLRFLRIEDMLRLGIPMSQLLGFEPQFAFDVQPTLDPDYLEFINEIKGKVASEHALYNYQNPNALVVPARLYGEGQLIEVFNHRTS